MVPFDQFDAIRIINLGYRTDRRAEVRRELRRVGLENDPRVEFFEACTFPEAAPFSSKGARGVYHSQLAILEKAAADGHSVLILEDDIDFVEGAENYKLPDEWSIFYGGYSAVDPGDLLASDIVGAHMMGFSAAIVSELAAFLSAISFEDHHPPIDGAYVWFRRANPQVKTVFAEPPLGYQRSSRSDVADLRFFDRLPGFRQSASVARKLKRSIRNRSHRA